MRDVASLAFFSASSRLAASADDNLPLPKNDDANVSASTLTRCSNSNFYLNCLTLESIISGVRLLARSCITDSRRVSVPASEVCDLLAVEVLVGNEL